MNEFVKKAVASTLTMSVPLVFLTTSASFANTEPNEYQTEGISWVSVDEAEKVYLENLGSGSYDDDSIYYVGPGVECTIEADIYDGPFLTGGSELDESHCVDSSSNPFDPSQEEERIGATPFGFEINFFGTTYDSAWPNTNGGIFFDSPDNEYDLSIPKLAAEAQSSAMFALGADLEYASLDSNFWTAQTTVDGKDAVVFAWEKFHNCCVDDNESLTESEIAEDFSFQLVLIDLGAGDFNAYFNYEAFEDFNEGYDAESVYIDLATGPTPESNIFRSDDAQFIEADTCIAASVDYAERDRWDSGQITDEGLVAELEEGFYYQLNSISDSTVSLWADVECTEPILSNVAQDIETDGYAFIEFANDGEGSYESVAVGWATWDTETSKVEWTELLRNVDAEDLQTDSLSPLTSRSLNTDVPGRFVIGQRGGATVTDSASVAPPVAPAAIPTPPVLAKTGANVDSLLYLAVILVAAGIATTFGIRRKRA
jgi:hypothetical protein